MVMSPELPAPAGPRLGLDQRLVRMPRRNVVVDDRRAVAQRLRRRSVCLIAIKISL